MKSFRTLFWEKEILWITLITGMLGMVVSQGTAIIGPRAWHEAARTAAYSLHTETWLEWKFSLWPPLILAITVGIVKTARAFLRARDNFYPLLLIFEGALFLFGSVLFVWGIIALLMKKAATKKPPAPQPEATPK